MYKITILFSPPWCQSVWKHLMNSFLQLQQTFAASTCTILHGCASFHACKKVEFSWCVVEQAQKMPRLLSKLTVCSVRVLTLGCYLVTEVFWCVIIDRHCLVVQSPTRYQQSRPVNREHRQAMCCLLGCARDGKN